MIQDSNDNDKVQEQIDNVVLQEWRTLLIADIQTLRMAVHGAITYLELEPDHEKMIDFLNSQLLATFNPDECDCDGRIAA